MVYMGVLAIFYVFFSTFTHSPHSVSSVPAKKIDVSQMQKGEVMLLSWDGRPVLIYRRQDADLSALRSNDERLLDAQSRKSDQPANALNAFRSVSPEWFVAIAVGMDQGCSIAYLPSDSTLFQAQPWQGGFIDSCRESRYDLSGRVFESQYATRNLVVPPYRLDEQTVILGQ